MEGDEAKLAHQLDKLNVTPVEYVAWKGEEMLPDMMRMIEANLSEPYTVYTYRYFLVNWPNLCWMAYLGGVLVGCIVCKLDKHKQALQGYIGMLVVDEKYRGRGIASKLVKLAVESMEKMDVDHVTLETETTNLSAIGLYESLGFIKDKRLARYYLNGVDAFRLKLFFRRVPAVCE
jgi:peptide alpha-N-acetyltransferase